MRREDNPDYVVCVCLTASGDHCGESYKSIKGTGETNVWSHIKNHHPYYLPGTQWKLRPKGAPKSRDVAVMLGGITTAGKVREKKKKLAEALARFIAQSYLPFSVVEFTPFRMFLKDMGVITYPHEVPSRRTLMKYIDSYSGSSFQQCIQDFKESVQSGGGILRITMSADGGVASDFRSVMAYIAHGVSIDGNLSCIPLKVMPFLTDHTADKINEQAVAALAVAGLTSANLAAAVHDSAANMVAAFSSFEDFFNGKCMVHAINTMLGKLEKVKGEDTTLGTLIGYTKTIHSAFSHSAKSRVLLRQVQEKLANPATGGRIYPRILKVRDSVKTRFCSSILQVQRYIALLPALKELTKDAYAMKMFPESRRRVPVGGAGVGRETFGESPALDRARYATAVLGFAGIVDSIPCSLAVLNILVAWTEILSCSYYPTVHVVRPFLRQMRDLFDDLLDDGTNKKAVIKPAANEIDKDLIGVIDDQFSHQFGGYYHLPPFRIGELLAPTHWRCDVPYGVGDAKKAADAPYWFEKEWDDDHFEATMVDYVLFHLDLDPSTAADSATGSIGSDCAADGASSAPAVAPSPNPRSRVSSARPQPPKKNTLKQTVKAEVAAYVTEIRAEEFVLEETAHWYDDFWITRRAKYPHLWKVARVVLAIPASSVTVESLFSVMGSVDSPRRQSMTTERICQLTLTNFMRFFKTRTAASHSQGVRGIKLPTYSISEPCFSWDRFPSEHDMDAVEQEELEAAAARGAITDLQAAEQEQLDDSEDEEEPASKRAPRGGGAGAGADDDYVYI